MLTRFLESLETFRIVNCFLFKISEILLLSKARVERASSRMLVTFVSAESRWELPLVSHFELIFVYCVRLRSRVNFLLSCRYPIVPVSFVERLPFLLLNNLGPFVENQLNIHMYVPKLSVLLVIL